MSLSQFPLNVSLHTCSRILGSSYTLIFSLLNGEGAADGSSGSFRAVNVLRIPSVVSRVRRYGDV